MKKILFWVIKLVIFIPVLISSIPILLLMLIEYINEKYDVHDKLILSALFLPTLLIELLEDIKKQLKLK